VANFHNLPSTVRLKGDTDASMAEIGDLAAELSKENS
jgi:hypothetical protein